MPNNILVDGNFTVPSPVSAPRFSAPFDGDAEKYILDQDFVVDAVSFAPLALGTKHNDGVAPFPEYRLVNESQPTQVGPGIVRFTRSYAKKPNTRSDYASLAYTFIGYYGAVANIAVASTFPIIGRARFSETVTARIQNDYYRIGNPLDGADFASVSDIPIIDALRYYIRFGTFSGATFTPSYAENSTDDKLNGVATDSIYSIKAPRAYPGAKIPTYPDRKDYETWVANGVEICAETSQISRWRGQIYQRVTKFVLPL